MEDLATGRMSVAQIGQRVRHRAKDTGTGEVHDFPLVKGLLQSEVEDILVQLKETVKEGDEAGQRAYSEAEVRYRKAVRISMRWIKNYTEFDFRSLGSYTRDDLESIAAAADAF